MTTTINASTSAGLVQTADTSGSLALQTAGTTAVTVDSSQNVGIGTSSPGGKLAVSTAQSSIISTSTTGTNNVLFQQNNTGGSFNVALENSSGGSIASGTSAYSAVLAHNGAYPISFCTSNTERMRIDSSGKLVMATSTNGLGGQFQAGITANTGGMNSVISVAGNSSGPYPFGARGETSSQGLFGFFDGSNNTIGSITRSGSNVAYNTSSDYRLKENIAPMTGALNTVAQLKPVTYKWKADNKNGQGFIAHELAEVVPDCVTGEKDAVDADGKPIHQGIDVSFLVATLTAAIQEQQATINALTARIEALENKA
jgi:hypothetical protein